MRPNRAKGLQVNISKIRAKTKRSSGEGDKKYFNSIEELFQEKSATLSSPHDVIRAYYRKHM
jgi:hypothetical protein